MSLSQFIFAPLIACLLSTIPVLAADIEYPNLNDDFSPCGKTLSLDEIYQLPTPEATHVGDASYISGGSCSDSVIQMKGLANSFPLEIVLVEQEGNKEVYLADVNVSIKDTKNNKLLEVVTDGAFLLVNLPDGQYEIISEYNFVSKNKKVNVNHNKHTKIVFLWDNKPKTD